MKTADIERMINSITETLTESDKQFRRYCQDMSASPSHLSRMVEVAAVVAYPEAHLMDIRLTLRSELKRRRRNVFYRIFHR